MQWRKVTENVFSKGQINKTLPSYIQLGDTICMNCYNGIIINISNEFQQHAQASINCEHEETDKTNEAEYEFKKVDETNEAENVNVNLSFSQAIAVITDILYMHENKEKKPPVYSFDEFKTIMEGKDTRLKYFFDELYLSSNPFSKNKESQTRVKR
jgi:hypothetical protein